MGNITVTVGPVSGSVSFDNVKGQEIIEGYIAENGGPVEATAAEKLQWFTLDLTRHVRESYRGHVVRQAREAAEAAEAAALQDWN